MREQNLKILFLFRENIHKYGLDAMCTDVFLLKVHILTDDRGQGPV